MGGQFHLTVKRNSSRKGTVKEATDNESDTVTGPRRKDNPLCTQEKKGREQCRRPIGRGRRLRVAAFRTKKLQKKASESLMTQATRGEGRQ